MQEAVTDVLRARSQQVDRVGRAMMGSFAVHGVAIAMVVIAPKIWPHHKPEPPLMVITLGTGAEGPKTGGVTPLAGRPVEDVAPPPKRAVPIPMVPPKSAVAPEPEPAKKPAVKPKPKLDEYTKPPTLIPRPPTTGAVIAPGLAAVETGAKGTGTGLATGAAGDHDIELDVKNFCCPDYLNDMKQVIRSHIDLGTPEQGEVVVSFIIQKDGTLKDAKLEKGSPFEALNLAAQRGLRATPMVPKLPREFTGNQLTVHLTISFGRQP